jgi:hypothetical protein
MRRSIDRLRLRRPVNRLSSFSRDRGGERSLGGGERSLGVRARYLASDIDFCRSRGGEGDDRLLDELWRGVRLSIGRRGSVSVRVRSDPVNF